MASLKIKRVVDPYEIKNPFELKNYIEGNEMIEADNGKRPIKFIIGMIPLDCIDDITRADIYNPRAMRPIHRDNLMLQMGTYGLVSPLVAILEKTDETKSGNLFLIDGRHRFNGLIELDQKLKSYLETKNSEEEGKKFNNYISSKKNLSPPKNYSKSVMNRYAPEKEPVGLDKQGTPMVPVKIYLDAGEIEAIGMAVFLNRGQKKLSGGEKIGKVAKAYQLALDKQKMVGDGTISEIKATKQIQNIPDTGNIISSWIVSEIIEQEDSFWVEVVGRWQGEKTKDETKIKPLTSNNFLAFVRNLIDDKPKEIYDQGQRDREIQNLIKLGEIFYKIFNWPDDFPDSKNRYTPTSILSRSFLIDAIGAVINERNRKNIGQKVMSEILEPENWRNITNQILKINAEFKIQASKRIAFETLKQELNDTAPNADKRNDLLIKIDELRGVLWTLDTVVATLKGRVENVIKASSAKEEQ